MNTCIECGTQIDPRSKARCKPCMYKRGGNYKHGHAPNGHPSLTRNSWQAMRQRCGDTKHVSFPRYGGRGIGVCTEWHDFAQFFSDMGERPGPEYSLDRIDPKKDYYPSNCRWLLTSENVARSNVRTAYN